MEYIPAKSIVYRTKNTSWFGTHYNMNIYRGCCHGCIYCDSRSSCYGDSDFDTVKVKADALQVIRNDLRRKVRGGVVGTGAMSDPYNPLEKELQLSTHALELLSAFSFGVAVATKSDLVVRDLDVLQEIGERTPVLVKITVTTTNEALCAKLEPHAPTATQRLEAVQKLSKGGIFAGILLMPVLPYIEDSEDSVLDVVRRAAENGARFVYPAFGVTLRENQRDYFFAQLDRDFPGIKQKYISQFGTGYECRSPNAKKLWEVFQNECERLGLLYKMKDIVGSYTQGYGDSQLSWF